MIFSTKVGAKSWHGRSERTTNQTKSLLDNWDVSVDLPVWDGHPIIIKETRFRRPDIVIHSASTQRLIMEELTIIPYGKYRIKDGHIDYKREENLTLITELDAGYKPVVMPVEIGVIGFLGSSVYNLMTKLSICDNKRTKTLKVLAVMV